jgi:hypothetical protein
VGCGVSTETQGLLRVLHISFDRSLEASLLVFLSLKFERIVKESMTVMARLLHYFPPPGSPSSNAISKEEDDSWCALHVDDGCLTGLTSALFVDESAPLPPLNSSTFKSVPSFLP